MRTVGELNAELKKLDCVAEQPTPQQVRKSAQAKLDWLREQVEMRTRGLQWVEMKAAWSSASDEHVGSIEELTGHLKEIIQEERERRQAGELPEQAPAPIFKRKSFKELGTPTAQAEELAAKYTELSVEEFREAAEQERERLQAVGEIDRVSDLQPAAAPSFASLVGRQVEVRWRYWVKDPSRKSKRRQVYIWCTAEVVEVADGRTTKASSRCKSPLPWGAVRLKFALDQEREEPEHFVWSVLKPADFDREVHLGWRYAESELEKLAEAEGKLLVVTDVSFVRIR